MTAIIIVLSIALLVVVILQISRLTELYALIRGEDEVELRSNRNQGRAMLLFMIGLLILVFLSAYWLKNYMMGYGPHQSASVHGDVLDSLFDVTLVFTGIVFVITHIAIFYLAYRYKRVKGSKGTHWAHNNTLEIVWSAIPAVVMTYLVIKGLLAWNTVMADVSPDEEVMEIEATGYQFAWHLRYPGSDGVIGARDFHMTTADNPLGQDWADPKNFDDIHPDELWIPVNQKVRVRILARDVLHSFYLPHFRVKMDALPGLPTYFVFTPTKTTEEYREELSKYPEYNVPKDPADPTSPLLWEDFNYELACAELCGKSHYSMRRIVRIVTEEEYAGWLEKQKPYYQTTIRNTDSDPNKGKMLEFEIIQNRDALNLSVEKAIVDSGIPMTAEEVMSLRTIRLDYVQYETGKTILTSDTKYQLDDLADILIKYPKLRIEIGVHSDNTGNPAEDKILTQQRAEAVGTYLMSKGVAQNRFTTVGYGQSKPIDTNATDAGRQKTEEQKLKL